MKNLFQRGLSLFVVALMLASQVPTAVMAEESGVSKEPEVTQEPVSTDSSKTLSNDTQTLSNDTADVTVSVSEPVKTQEVVTDQTEQNVPQDSLTTDPLQTSDNTDQGFTYADIDGGVRITGYTQFGGEVVIPSTLNSKKVLEIGQRAFYNKKAITSINLPAGITKIGNSAFYGCSSMGSINIPDSVTTIGEYVFYDCSALSTIILPENLTSIGGRAFFYCTSLTSINIPDSVTTIGEYAFRACTGLKTINIPKAVTTLYGNSFYQCNKLTSITVAADNLKYASIDGVLLNKAGNSLIRCPEGIISLSIPEGVNKIEAGAFSNCTGLLSVSIPKSMTKISDNAFANCSGLTTVNIAEDVMIIGESAFENCTSLWSVNLPAGVTSIGASAFNNCKNLSSIVIPDGITNIAAAVFRNCTSLPSVSIPASVTSIGDQAFYNCKSLTAINLPEGVSSIGAFAFAGCTGVMKLSIPEGVIRIGSSAFNGCSELKSISLPVSLNSISTNAFGGCTYLTSITVAEDNQNYTGIGGVLYNKEATALLRCPEGLANISIPQGVTSIADNAFDNCDFLTTINIPQGVTSIGRRAFYHCSILSKLAIPESVSRIGDGAVSYCPLLTIHGVSGSFAEGFAKQQGKSFVNIVALSVKSFDADKASGQAVNTDVRLTAAGTGGSTPYQYKFYYKLGGTMATIQDYSKTSTATFKPTAAGSYTLYVDVKDVNGFTSTKSIESFEVTGNGNVNVTGVTISDATKNMMLGTDFNLTATVSPENATNKAVNWSSNQEDVASVDNAGKVTAHKAGTATITATTVDGNRTATCVVTVNGLVSLQSIAVTTPATKLSYKVGETLDISGLVVTGTYSDNTTKVETITASNISGFDSSKVAANQRLTITVNGKTITYTVQITESGNPGQAEFVAFLGLDPESNYYEYNATDLSSAYLAYQINPGLASAKMYQQFLDSQCMIVALKDGAKGYMDYQAAAAACLVAQIKGESFDINAYFGKNDAKRYEQTVNNLRIVDKNGNVQSMPNATVQFYPSLLPGKKTVLVKLDTVTPLDYTVSYDGILLTYGTDYAGFKGDVAVDVAETLKPVVARIQ